MGVQLRCGPQRGRRRDARPARRQGRQPRRDGLDRPARAARLHHHHRGLHRVLQERPAVSGRARSPGPFRAGTCGTGGGPALRRPAQAAARFGPVRRAGVDAGDDGHGAEPRAERCHGGRSGGGGQRRPLRLGQLPPVHPDVRLGRARRRPSPVRGDHRPREARRRGERGHCADRPGLAPGGGRLQGHGGGRNRQAVPAGSGRTALGRDRRRVRQLDEPARHHLPPAARHLRRLGHRGERAGDGVRQHGRGLRHRGLFHP